MQGETARAMWAAVPRGQGRAETKKTEAERVEWTLQTIGFKALRLG